MKLKNILIVVKDIEKSRQFYRDLFGLDLILDNNGNMILTEGLVLQDEKIWKEFLGRDIIQKSNSCELYFEEQDIEAFIKKLEVFIHPFNMSVSFPLIVGDRRQSVSMIWMAI